VVSLLELSELVALEAWAAEEEVMEAWAAEEEAMEAELTATR
jgi:hypothetical protein